MKRAIITIAMLSATMGAQAQSVSVREVPAAPPEFGRIYTKKLDARATMALKAWTSSYSGRLYAGTLTQPNGAWVIFEPDNVAERILDPTLVPLVKKAVAEAVSMDKAFIASKPRSFKDEKGVVWSREVVRP